MNESLNIVIAAEFALAEKITECLEQSDLDVNLVSVAEIYPFREEQGIRFNNKSVAQYPITEINWSETNYLFFAGDMQHIEHLVKAAEVGCRVIDMKGLCASLSDVPLVVPSINEQQLTLLRQRNIVCLPDPQVTQAALALGELSQECSLSQVFITSLLPASYVSGETVEQLAGQTAQLLNGIPLNENQQRLAFDVFPKENANLAFQLQKILPQIEYVYFHQIQAPVFYGLGQKVTVMSNQEYDLTLQIKNWQQNDFITYDADKVITPVTNGEIEGQLEEVSLHISQFKHGENGIEFWSVSDEQRFALAFMAVQLAECVYRQGY